MYTHAHVYTQTQGTYNGAWYARIHLNSVSPPAARSSHIAQWPSNPYLLLLLPYLKLSLASTVPRASYKTLKHRVQDLSQLDSHLACHLGAPHEKYLAGPDNLVFPMGHPLSLGSSSIFSVPLLVQTLHDSSLSGTTIILRWAMVWNPLIEI